MGLWKKCAYFKCMRGPRKVLGGARLLTVPNERKWRRSGCSRREQAALTQVRCIGAASLAPRHPDGTACCASRERFVQRISGMGRNTQQQNVDCVCHRISTRQGVSIVLRSLLPVEQSEQCRNGAGSVAAETENFAYDIHDYQITPGACRRLVEV